jgi:hypothetical protein
MTAEAIVMNTQGLALAADSAVTIVRGEDSAKIFTSANKIFQLSKFRPVAVMIHGNAGLLGVPWELIIKTYRKQLGEDGFDTIGGYVADFARFLGESDWLFPDETQDAYVDAYVGEVLKVVAAEIKREVRGQFEAGKYPGRADIEQLMSRYTAGLRRAVEAWRVLPLVRGDHEARVLSQYGRRIRRLIRESFESAPLTAQSREDLESIAVAFLTREPADDPENTSGVVIAGYGDRDVFPCFESLTVDGVAAGSLIGWPASDGIAISRESRGFVGAFAQREMVHRFMEGVDLDYHATAMNSVDRILSGYTNQILKKVGKRSSPKLRRELADAREAIITALDEELFEFRRENYVSGVLDVVGVLPLEELAHMADSLVNLTSFKRRVSMETESVAGPIDVAVISRGDGFIWIKRKHYFDPVRNPHFLANYYREDK